MQVETSLAEDDDRIKKEANGYREDSDVMLPEEIGRAAVQARLTRI